VNALLNGSLVLRTAAVTAWCDVSARRPTAMGNCCAAPKEEDVEDDHGEEPLDV
jgi:hypothetical protein